MLEKLQTESKIFAKSKKTLQKPKIVNSNQQEKKVPQFMTLSKLDWDRNEIHAGVIKDPTAKGGLRYQIIEPVFLKENKKHLK